MSHDSARRLALMFAFFLFSSLLLSLYLVPEIIILLRFQHASCTVSRHPFSSLIHHSSFISKITLIRFDRLSQNFLYLYTKAMQKFPTSWTWHSHQTMRLISSPRMHVIPWIVAWMGRHSWTKDYGWHSMKKAHHMTAYLIQDMKGVGINGSYTTHLYTL